MIKKEVSELKNIYWENRCREIDGALRHSRSVKALIILSSLKKDTRGTSIINPIGTLIWEEYYRKASSESNTY